MKKNKSISASRLPKKASGKCCNARTKQRAGYCRKPSGWGTEHTGQGRCRVHGGLTPTKHGVYSKILPAKFHELLEEIKPRDITDLTHEIIKLKTLLIELTEADEASEEVEIDLDDNGNPIMKRFSNLTIQEKIEYTIKIISAITKASSAIEANRERAAKHEDYRQEFLKFISPLVDALYEELDFVVKDELIKRADIGRTHKEKMMNRTIYD